jgi:hypothetical protein
MAYLFPKYVFCINFEKRLLATFWATFSQTHLVTLLLADTALRSFVDTQIMYRPLKCRHPKFRHQNVDIT